MTYHFRHFISDFMQFLGPERALAPADYNQYFGNRLSKELRRLPQALTGAGIPHAPRLGAPTLVTMLDDATRERFQKTLVDSRTLMEHQFPRIIRWPRVPEPHLTWYYFQRADGRLLDKLHERCLTLIPPLNAASSGDTVPNVRFGRLALLEGGRDGKTALTLHLAPLKEDETILQNYLEILAPFFQKESVKKTWKPHISLGRLPAGTQIEEAAFAALKNHWEREPFTLNLDHLVLIRTLDGTPSQKVFGIFREE